MFKLIPGYPDYMINENGEVLSLKNNKMKILKPSLSKHGYYRVNLCINNKVCDNKIHRLLGITFLNCPDNMQIDHIDGNRKNNSLSNLRVVTKHENSFNQTNAKGYTWHKYKNKWMASIRLNFKSIHLGYFDTEEDAHAAYLKAKEKYHVIETRS